MRHAIKSHFVEAGEPYIDVIEKYVSPLYEPGDILSISEKIIAISQNRIIYKKDLKVGFWAVSYTHLDVYKRQIITHYKITSFRNRIYSFFYTAVFIKI